MKKKVVEVNLMGLIFVTLLIIGGIVGAVIGINYFKKDKQNNNLPSGNGQIQGENENIDENKEYKELVKIGEEEKEITMKICKGSSGYAMKYDIDTFYVDKAVNGVDEFKSLTSDTIFINVKKQTEDFDDMVNDLILDENRSKNWIDYKINQIEIDGQIAYKEIMKNDSENIIYYYVKTNDGYFAIEAHCGNEFADSMIPVIEKMAESFEI